MGRGVVDVLGEEVTGIVAPVSICMALTVVLVRVLNPEGTSQSSAVYIASIAYDEQDTDSAGKKFSGALLNAIIFACVVGAMTFVLFLLFKYRCYKFIYAYMGFAVFNIFFFMTGALTLQLIEKAGLHIDAFSFTLILFNFSVVGTLSLFFIPAPLLLKQAYLIDVGIIVAFIFTLIPPWTSWLLLVVMAIYDLVAVLCPGGPLRVLVELAMEREDELPALVYEARPVGRGYQRGHWSTRREGGGQGEVDAPPEGGSYLPVVATRQDMASGMGGTVYVPVQPAVPPPPRGGEGRGEAGAEAGGVRRGNSVVELMESPRVSGGEGGAEGGEEERRARRDVEGGRREEGEMGALAVAPRVHSPVDGADSGSFTSNASETPLLTGGIRGSASPGPPPASPLRHAAGRHEGDDAPPVVTSGPEGEDGGHLLPDSIKLGLGDFIFYSMMVGRAAMTDMMTVFATYLAIIAGLGITLLLLAVARKALPALPFSIALGVLFYFLCRLVLEPFLVPLAAHTLYI